MSRPTFTCIIPCYNGADHLAEAIDSARTQQPPPLEILVADDGSTDDSRAIAEGYGTPVRVLKLDRGGVSRARNAAAAQARGDWLAFLDADDAWLPGHLAALGEAIELAPPDTALAFSARIERVDETGETREPQHRIAPHGGWIYPELCRHNFITPSACAIARPAFERLGGFPAGVCWGEDYDLWCRAALRHPAAFTGRVGCSYRVHEASTTARMDREGLKYETMAGVLMLSLAEIDEARRDPAWLPPVYTPEVLAECRGVIETRLETQLARAAGHYHRGGDRPAARRCLVLALRHRPFAPRLMLRWLKTWYR